jgi:cysteine-rich repeat protein
VSDLSRRPSAAPRRALLAGALRALLLLTVAGMPRAAGASQVLDAAPLTSNAVEDQFPRASAGQLAWQQQIAGDAEIRFFDGLSVVPVTDANGLFDVDPRLSDGNLVWKQSLNGIDCDLERYSGGSTTDVALGIPCVSEIRVAGPHVIWTDAATGGVDVFVRTGTNAPVQLGADDVSEATPRVGDVAGDPRAAWTEPDGSLWYWNGADAPEQVVPSGASDPEMDGARVVFVHDDGNDKEIMVYDGSSLLPLTDNDYDDEDPDISGANVAWIGYPDTPAEGEVFVFDGVTTLRLTNDALKDRTPKVSDGPAGPTVAWVKNTGDPLTGDEVWMYEGCDSVRVTDNAVADVDPVVDGNGLAWVQGGGDQSEIWTATVLCDSLCGNGALDGAEECDDGNNTAGDGCDEACFLEVCGNGRLQTAAGEECDDGGNAPGDGCDAGCLLECGNGTPEGSEECDDGNRVSGDGCSDTCLAEVCGNARIDFGEACDDGNTVDGDGCSGSCVAEAPASKTHQKCINALNKAGAKLAVTQGKLGLACLDDAAAGNTAGFGTPATAQDCLSNDPDGKLARVEAKAAAAEGKKCDPGDLPGFAYAGSAAVIAGAEAEGVALVGDLFGPDLGAATIADAVDKAGARCQQDVLKATESLSNTAFKLAVKQKKRLIAGKGGALAVSDPALELSLLGYLQADAKGKLGKKAGRIESEAARRCGGVTLDSAFPGCAPSADATALASCASRAARCRFCRALNAFDGLAMDCDSLDDATANASCP